MALGAVLFVAVILAGLAGQFVVMGLLLLIALPYWWFDDSD